MASTSGSEPRSEEERREWAQLDAEHEASGLEEFRLEQAYELDDSDLSWSDWLAVQRSRGPDQERDRSDVEAIAIPEEYADALGPDRVERLEQMVGEARDAIDRSPLSGDALRQELSAQAKEYGPAARALDMDLSRRVVALEADIASLTEEIMSSVDELPSMQGERDVAREDLAALSREPGHPDRWMEDHGRPFTSIVRSRASAPRSAPRSISTDDRQPDDRRRVLLYRHPPRNDLSPGARFRYGESSDKGCSWHARIMP